MDTQEFDNETCIAVIGMSGRFPEASSIAELWSNLISGRESVKFYSNEELLDCGVDSMTLNKDNYVKAGIELNNKYMFDREFFGLSPLDTKLICPQQRLLLECAYETLEIAGYSPEENKHKVGVFTSADLSSYLIKNIREEASSLEGFSQAQLIHSNSSASTKISYHLNLSGPSLDINTACSSSLVSLHVACQSLLLCECDMALAGGASINAYKQGYLYYQDGILSPDGHCRAFDINAQGTISGQGVVLVLLKRLVDAINDNDNIEGIIRGTAINNDAANKVGYTAPSVIGQTTAIRQALDVSNVSANQVSYIECHGTGTQIGDQIELSALSEIFKINQEEYLPCYFSSLKSNIGHLNSAAGVAGLIKTLLILKNKKIPPAINFSTLNSNVDLSATRLKISNKIVTLSGKKSHIAGVSSFGIGGTNAHVVVQSYEQSNPMPTQVKPHSTYIISLSAKTASALSSKKRELQDYLRKHNDLSIANIAYTLNAGRTAYHYRQAIVAIDNNDLIDKLSSPKGFQNIKQLPKKSLVFLISGQGTQRVNMGKSLYNNVTAFRDMIQVCAKQIKMSCDIDILSILYPTEENSHTAETLIQNPLYAHPIIFAFNYSLAHAWVTLGLVPDYMLGHSLGEYVAACLSGVITLATALDLVIQRAKLISTLPPGKMFVVASDWDGIQEYLSSKCSLAAINGKNSYTISIDDTELHNITNLLNKKNTPFVTLNVSHAYHSTMFDEILAPYEEVCRQHSYQSATIPYLSCLTGQIMNKHDKIGPEYWAKQMRHTVQFYEGVNQLPKEGSIDFLEIGPTNSLGQLIPKENNKYFSSLTYHHSSEDEYFHLLSTLGDLWMTGHFIDWVSFHDHGSNFWKVPLPTYPFERKHYCIGKSDECLSDESDLNRAEGSPTYRAPTNFLEEDLAQWWSDILGIKQIGIDDDFFLLGGNSLLATQINTRLYEKYNIKLSVKTFLKTPTITSIVNAILAEQLTSLESDVIE